MPPAGGAGATPVAPVGVFDSGVGGLSIAIAIHARLPGVPILYFADTAYAPYGGRSEAEILERTRVCCGRLLDRGVQALVVACNTATANAIDAIRPDLPVPVIGVEPGLKPAAARSRTGVVGVLATQATLASERYRRLQSRIEQASPGVRFVGEVGRGWVELVESGQLEGPGVDAAVAAAVHPLIVAGADTLVLGCTHYPFLRASIERAAPGVPIVETGSAIARELERRLPSTAAGADARTGDTGRGRPEITLESSGDPALLERMAARLLAEISDPSCRPAP